jgi:threonyl-tRNA synthetase
MGNKIRKAQALKVPYMLIIGDQEKDHQTVNVRLRTEEKRGEMPVPEFISYINDINTNKTLEL